MKVENLEIKGFLFQQLLELAAKRKDHIELLLGKRDFLGTVDESNDIFCHMEIG
jgi:hypothetical protein